MSSSWAARGTFAATKDHNAAIARHSKLTKYRGLGALIVQDFAREGSNVAINYVSSKDAAEELAGEVRSQFGVKAITIQGVCGSGRWQACCTRTDEEHEYRMQDSSTTARKL